MKFDLADVLARLRGVRPCAGGWIGCCPAHEDHNASLSVRESDSAKLLLKCFAGCSYEAIRAALDGCESKRSFGLGASPGATLDDTKRIELARKLWREAQPATGTTIERYLRATRGLTVPPPPTLRFAIGRHAPSHSGPWAIMVAAVQDAAGRIVAIHRTYLTGDGRKAPVDPVKMALGPIGGGAVRLAKAGERLALSEGIETALSVMQATSIPTWAALGTANLPRVRLPDCVREVIIAADGDDAGERGAQQAAQRFLCEGRRVRIARPSSGKDFNEMRL